MSKEQKSKVFKDATLGYISVDERYVSNLIDTFEMQRLKDVAQTGIRPIYSGATHDRFSHSLGVYHIGRKIYSAFQKNIEKNLSGVLENKTFRKLLNVVEYYREYYYIACILHDIGHPAFSHTFEYIYKNKYINLGEGDATEYNFQKEIERIASFEDKVPKSTLDSALCEKIENATTYSFLEVGTDSGNAKGKKVDVRVNTAGIVRSQGHHEKMGAYQILTSGDLKECIERVLGKGDIDFCFIACMITGLPYEGFGEITEEERWEFNLRNCIIRLLNGLIDADSIDYLNRNSHFAGYATSSLDVERLCNAFSVYYDQRRREILPCFEKSALSAIEGFVNARNFEPKWLYNHHKIVYHDEYLVKYLYKKCNRYLFALCQGEVIGAIVSKLVSEIPVQYRVDVTGTLNVAMNKEVEKKKYREVLNIFRNKVYYFYLIEKNVIGRELKFCEFVKEYSCDVVFRYIANPVLKLDFDSKEMKNLQDYQLDFLRKWINVANDIVDLMESHGGIINVATSVFMKINEALEKGGSATKILDDTKNMVNTIRKWCRVYGALRDSFLINAFAPIVPFDTNALVFWKSSDSDICTLFKMMYLKYRNIEFEDLTDNEKSVGVEREFVRFKRALKEFNTRKYRQSLWKSEDEYKLMLQQISKTTGLPIEVINTAILEVISCSKGAMEEFEDPDTFLTSLDSNAVYVNSLNENSAGSHFHDLFSVFGDGMVIKIYRLKYKNFDKLKVNFGSFGWSESGNETEDTSNIVSYAEIGGRRLQTEEYFPYLFYDVDDFRGKAEFAECFPSEDKVYTGKLQRKLLAKLKEEIVRFLFAKYGKGGDEVLSTMNYIRDGKVIRDAIYGDIFIPRKFLRIIDTRAFQRLRRIKQLATADFVFPEATHSRFAHSLGVFHIMSLMLEHFCRLFDYLQVKYSETDKDAILAAALLHDIGHGPYSHAFENMSETSHEEWTEKIILEDRELSSILKEEFTEDFPNQVIRYMNYKGTKDNSQRYTLSSVFASLINSQLDADRLDYLLRDANNTGVELGSIDLQKIIASLELTKHDGEVRVCVSEDAIANIEQIILGRYNMYAKVYNSPYKVFSEELLNQIVKRIKENSKLLNKSTLLTKLCDKSMSVEEYLQLDDAMFFDEIVHCVRESDDEILKEMVDSFYYRNGYVRLRILDESMEMIEQFLKELNAEYGIAKERFCCSLICPKKSYAAYNCKEDNAILISKRDGSVSDVTSESMIFRNEQKKNANGQSEQIWFVEKGYVYINYDIMAMEYRQVKNESFTVKESVMEFIDSYDIRKHIEIEEKYSCSKEHIERAKALLSSGLGKAMSPYKVQRTVLCGSEQSDCYYDTKDFRLAREGYSLRCRDVGGKKIFSIKCSIDSNNGKNRGQFVRSEFEKTSVNGDIHEPEVCEFIKRHLSTIWKRSSETFSVELLEKKLEIKNNRYSYVVVRGASDDECAEYGELHGKSDFKCEISLDSIQYIHGEKVENDYQIEIELKSAYHIFKVELKEFAEKLLNELNMQMVENELESKYRKALKRLGL